MALKKVIRLAIIASVVVQTTYSYARSPSNIEFTSYCEDAARAASVRSGVPLDVLRAITLTETGRKKNGRFEPWPWTVNMEGKGRWFDDRAEAEKYIENSIARGARSFDIGCFQINHLWHGKAFGSFRQMFDPIENANYAAQFLSDLYAEFGDWSRAAGAYHSRTPKYANKYKARFDRIRQSLNSGPTSQVRSSETQQANPTVPSAQNDYPLLRRVETSPTAGSLVPLPASVEARRFIDIARPQK